jgi:hypothetical protein
LSEVRRCATACAARESSQKVGWVVCASNCASSASLVGMSKTHLHLRRSFGQGSESTLQFRHEVLVFCLVMRSAKRTRAAWRTIPLTVLARPHSSPASPASSCFYPQFHTTGRGTKVDSPVVPPAGRDVAPEVRGRRPARWSCLFEGACPPANSQSPCQGGTTGGF